MTIGIDDLKEELSAAMDAVPPGMPDPLGALFAREKGLSRRLLLATHRRRSFGHGVLRPSIAVVVVFTVAVAAAIVVLIASPLANHSDTGTAVLVGGSTGPCAGGAPGCDNPDGTAGALVNGRWSSFPGGPLSARSGEIYAWTGKDLVVWGGITDQPAPVGILPKVLADGAAYDPVTHSWHRLPQSPLTGRENASDVWAGSELIIWGGDDLNDWGTGGPVFGDGAAYLPTTNTWEMLPPAPIEPRTDATIIWTGRQVIVFGGRDSDGNYIDDGATYDPGSRTWSVLPALPSESGTPVGASAIWTGSELITWVTYEVRNNGLYGSTDVEELPVGSSEWKRLPISNDTPSTYGATTTWTGSEALVFGGGDCFPGESCGQFLPTGHGSVYLIDPEKDQWTTMAVPTNPTGLAVSTGKALIVLQSRQLRVPAEHQALVPDFGIVFDIATAKWSRLPPSPQAGTGDEIWTGSQLLVWFDGSQSRANIGMELTPR